jgi:hypothetical protein
MTGDTFLSGTPGNLITITSDTAGSVFTLVKASGVITSDYVSLRDSVAGGQATWYATNSVNAGNNKRWIFGTQNSGTKLTSQIQKGSALINGLVASYTFNDMFGNVLRDYSGYQGHGELVGTKLPMWIERLYGGMQLWDGKNDYVNILNAPQHNTTILTIAAGIIIDNATGLRGIIEKTDGDGYDAWNLYVGSTQKLIFQSNSGGTSVASSRNVPVGRLVHVGVTVQGGTNATTLYLDGVPDGVGSSNTSLWTNTAYNLRIGCYYGSAHSFNGSIYYLHIWNRILTSSEMAIIAANPLTFYEPVNRYYLLKSSAGVPATANVVVVELILDTIESSISGDANVALQVCSLDLTLIESSISGKANASSSVKALELSVAELIISSEANISTTVCALTITENDQSINANCNIITQVSELSLGVIEATIASEII